MGKLFMAIHILAFLFISTPMDATDNVEEVTEQKENKELTQEQEEELEEDSKTAQNIETTTKEGQESAFSKILTLNELETPSMLTEEDKKNHTDTVESAMNVTEAVAEQLFEGDMELDRDDLDVLSEKVDINSIPEMELSKRHTVAWKKKLWRTREIGYAIDHPGTSSDSKAAVREAIINVLKEMESKTCLKFRAKNQDDQNWLEFYKGAGCHAGIGRRYYQRAPTRISLGELCISKGLIQHETLHALGFYHEQSRADRDTYVKVNFQNMRQDMKSNFERHKDYEGDTQNRPYDYGSVMHYSQTAFTTNGKPTIIDRFDPYRPLGGKEMTKSDYYELNMLYHCNEKDLEAWTKWTSWSPCYKTFRGECQRNRQRMCIAKERSKCPGSNDYGVEEKLETCKDANACEEILGPGWGSWTAWSECSQSQCGKGYRTRHRECNNPPPSSSAKQCAGAKSDTRICRYKKCSMSWYDTNFEKGFGMWTQDTDDNFDWTRVSGRSPSGNSGPNRDHTTGKGNYIVAVSGTGSFRSNMNGKVARLTSYELPANFGKKCLNFFYQMNGRQVDKLKIFIETQSKSTIFLWSRTGHQGNFWIPGSADLPQLNEPFKIKIEAKSGFGPYADIAIDDVYIDDGRCLPYQNDWSETNRLYCFLWRGSGYCYKKTTWMLNNCCQACSGMQDCTDINSRSSCEKWAKDGWCVSKSWLWKMWMWIRCCETCRDCTDKNIQCPYWAKQEGECDKDWMKTNCKTSCKVCEA